MRSLLKILLLFVVFPLWGNALPVQESAPNRKKKPYITTFVDTLVQRVRNQAKLQEGNRPDYDADKRYVAKR